MTTKGNKYRLKKILKQLPQEEYEVAMKVCYIELGISKETFFRDLSGAATDIPHYRLLKYCKFLQVDEKELESFDRDEIEVRPLAKLMDKVNTEELRSLLNFQKI